MKKRIKKIMICIMVAVLVFTAMPTNSFAAEPTIVETGKCGDNVTYTLDSDGLLTISGEGEMRSYYYKGDGRGFRSPFPSEFCNSVKRVVIQNGVTSICSAAFEGFENLSNISISDSVLTIGGDAFCSCISLKSIVFPKKLEAIYFGAFSGCSSIESIFIPESVYDIHETAFWNCSDIISITIDKNNKVYDSRNNCNAIIETASNTLIYGCKNTVIPNSITSIGDYAFCNCSKLTSVTIPNSVTSIGDFAFDGCTGLTSVTIGNSVASIGDDAFDNTDYYNNSANWDNGVLYIGNYLIEAKGTIKGEYKIKDGTKVIADEAFYNCWKLTSVTIPNSVTSIGDYAFYGCTGLTSVTIPSSVTSIGDYAFYGCTGLTSVTIPSSVTSIGNSVFYGCTGLTSVTIPDSVMNIGYNAFDNTDYYNNSENWDNGVLYISNYLIKAKDTIEGEYKIKDGTKVIADEAFYNCWKLTSVTIPNSVTSIGDYAFRSCTGLTSVIIPNSVTSIGDFAFYYCTGLTSIAIPNSVTSIGELAFCDCAGLTSIAIPNSVTNIGECAFYGCTGLTSVTIPNSVTSIGDFAFSDCTGLTNITISDKVTNIDEGAFYTCNNLSDVYYSGTQEQWNKIIIFEKNECLTNATIHYNWSPCEESNITVNGKDYSVIMDYGAAFDDDVELNISKSDSGNFEIPLNPFLSLNINAVSDGKEVQPDKPVTLMFEKSMFNCGVDELTIFHFPDGKTPETFNNRKTDSAYHITEKTLDGKTYYCITVSSLSPFIFTDGTGDVNSDGTVNSSDALTVLQHSVGKITLTDNTFTRADVDRNKTVNSADALKILQFSVGQITTF